MLQMSLLRIRVPKTNSLKIHTVLQTPVKNKPSPFIFCDWVYIIPSVFGDQFLKYPIISDLENFNMIGMHVSLLKEAPQLQLTIEIQCIFGFDHRESLPLEIGKALG